MLVNSIFFKRLTFTVAVKYQILTFSSKLHDDRCRDAKQTFVFQFWSFLNDLEKCKICQRYCGREQTRAGSVQEPVTVPTVACSYVTTRRVVPVRCRGWAGGSGDVTTVPYQSAVSGTRGNPHEPNICKISAIRTYNIDFLLVFTPLPLFVWQVWMWENIYQVKIISLWPTSK